MNIPKLFSHSVSVIILVLFCSSLSYCQSKEDSLFSILDLDINNAEAIQELNTMIVTTLYQRPAEVVSLSSRLDSLLSGHQDVYARAETKNTFGLALYVNQRFDEAIDQLLTAMRLFEQLDNQSKIARVSNSLAIVYQVRKEATTSAEYWEKALSIYESLNDSLWMANVAANLGGHYMEHNEFEKADALFEKACPIFEKLGRNGLLGYAKLNQGSLRVKQGRSEEAIDAFNTTFQLIPFEANPLIHAVANTGIGNAYLDLGQMGKAKGHLQKGYDISVQIGQAEQQKAASELLSTYYERTQDYKKAFTYHKEWSVLQDSFLTAAEDARLVDALSKYEAEKREQEIALLSAENEIKDLRIDRSNRNLIYALLGLGFLSLFAIYFYRSRQQTRQLNSELEEQKKVISKSLKEKEFLLKEIHHRVKNNLQVISSLLKLQSKSVTDEKAQQALSEGRNRVRSMALIHQNLYPDGSNLGGIKVQAYVQQLTSELLETYSIKEENVTLHLQIDELTLDVDTVVPLGLIINELVSNSLKYGFPNGNTGEITISLFENEEGFLILKVTDNGIGYDASKIPTKSFGHRLVRAFAERLNADCILSGTDGAAAKFVIRDYKKAA